MVAILNFRSEQFKLFLACRDYVPGELMLSPSHGVGVGIHVSTMFRRLSVSASALAQCLSFQRCASSELPRLLTTLVAHPKISPTPLGPCFFTNHDGLNNLGRGSPKKHFCKIILKSVRLFLTRRFLKFSI